MRPSDLFDCCILQVLHTLGKQKFGVYRSIFKGVEGDTVYGNRIVYILR